MTEIFKIALSGFWPFCGAVILMSIILHYAVIFYALTLSAITGRPVKINQGDDG